MTIINKLHIQLSKIKSILDLEKRQRKYSYDYYIREDKCKFLDIFELQNYLSETSIKNTIFLEGINELCSYIMDVWNNNFQKMPMKTFKEDFHYKGKYFSGYSTLDFHALYVLDNKIKHYNTLNGKRKFVQNYNFSQYNIRWIADRCRLILNFITAAYPETINDLKKSQPNKYESLAWFKVGLLFASGEIEHLKLKHHQNCTKIAQEKFGDKWKKFRPYISDSMGNITNRDKNIFSNNNKLLKIKEHCLENNIRITKDFINQIKPE